MSEDFIDSSAVEEVCEGVFLRSIDVNRRLSACTDTAEFIKHNKDLQDKL